MLADLGTCTIPSIAMVLFSRKSKKRKQIHEKNPFNNGMDDK